MLMIARAPLQLFQAVSTSILPPPDFAPHQTDHDSERQFHHSVRMVAMGIAGFTAVHRPGRGGRRPPADAARFLDKFTYPVQGLLLVTAGMGLYLLAVTVNQACLARARPAGIDPLDLLRGLLRGLDVPAVHQ
ncbi:MAG: hypothetical protein IPK93_13360 [Solirubrobacterales bacterium]|nr:hypothetical protein [Solirubrobacterales bacterium]